jgi:kinesin family protein C1
VLCAQFIELRGNIRVFCRLRPVVAHDLERARKAGGAASVEIAVKHTAKQIRVNVYVGGGSGAGSRQLEQAPATEEDSNGGTAFGNSNDLLKRQLSKSGKAQKISASLMNKPRSETRAFDFDEVCGPESTQADVFAEVEPVVKATLDGYCLTQPLV